MTLEVKVSKKLVPYALAYKELKKRLDSIKKHKSNDLIWILEHPLTYTGGIRSSEKEVLDKKITIIKTNRGGKITLHNPGQKIIYLVLDLNKRKKDIRNLVKNIEDSIIEFLKIYKIESYADKENIGIWVKKRKIAAIGIRVSQWIAYHGCSINISNSLKPYKKIVPCGLDNRKVTSLKNEIKGSIKNVEKNLKTIFVKNLRKI
jgi:lipoyl(octanoyl) transferase